MRAEKGFTLIELVAVIIILGILSATAIPKYMDLRSEAQISAVQSLRSTIESANQMIYARAVLLREHKKASAEICINQATAYQTGCLESDGTGFKIKYGHIFGSYTTIMHALEEENSGNFINTGHLGNGVKCPQEWCVEAWKDSVTGYTRTTNEAASDSKIAKLVPRGYAFDEQCGVVVVKNHGNNEAPKILGLTDSC